MQELNLNFDRAFEIARYDVSLKEEYRRLVEEKQEKIVNNADTLSNAYLKQKVLIIRIGTLFCCYEV